MRFSGVVFFLLSLAMVGPGEELRADKDEKGYYDFKVNLELQNLLPKVKSVITYISFMDEQDHLISSGKSESKLWPSDKGKCCGFNKGYMYAEPGKDQSTAVKYKVYFKLRDHAEKEYFPNEKTGPEWLWLKSKLGMALLYESDGPVPKNKKSDTFVVKETLKMTGYRVHLPAEVTVPVSLTYTGRRLLRFRTKTLKMVGQGDIKIIKPIPGLNLDFEDKEESEEFNGFEEARGMAPRQVRSGRQAGIGSRSEEARKRMSRSERIF